MDCEHHKFNPEYSQQRIAKAEMAIGRTLVQKILAIALFLLGMDRASISSRLSMPPGTIRSLIRNFSHNGVAALLDRRTRTQLPKAEQAPKPAEATISRDSESLKIQLAEDLPAITVPEINSVQAKVVLLSLLNSQILKCSEVASAIGLSEDRTLKLARKLTQSDVESIIDQRRGQQVDFRFTPQLKSELIQQFVIDIVTEGSTSGKQLAKHLEERCQITLSSRSILHHLSKLGLRHIMSSLPGLLEEAKKKSLRS
jgi:hypothetical protein